MTTEAIGGVRGFKFDDLAGTSKQSGGEAGGAKFSDLLGGLVKDADAQQKNSDALVQGLAKGEPVDVHQVVMALTEADLSFRTLLEVRNRLIEAYQEVQRMQV